MQLYNIKHNEEKVSFAQAVKQGLGKDQGLFFPSSIEPLKDVDALLAMPFVERSAKILRHLIGSDEIPNLEELVKQAFAFGASDYRRNHKQSPGAPRRLCRRG